MILEKIQTLLLSSLPTAIAVVLVILVLIAAHRIMERRKRKTGFQFRNQLVMTILSFAGLIMVVLALPVEDSTQNQLLGLLGICFSAAVAFSSTTFIGNAMAGIMLRIVKGFRVGDFISCQDNFGRVSERGLFHTEIQNEDRELITMPNLYLVTHPVTTIRKSGTIIWTRVSLGYDVPRKKVEECLIAAASAAGLEDSFVHVGKLGDFSVTYRVAGLLTEVKKVLSARSRLRAKVLDHLHDAGVEIVSPNFMNQRILKENQQFIPEVAVETVVPETGAVAEELVFDKAEEAESLEALKERHDRLQKEIAELKEAVKKEKDDTARKKLEARLERLRGVLASMNRVIEKREGKQNGAD